MNKSILLFLFLSLFFISSTSSSSSFTNTTHRCSVQQTLALLMFKQNLSSINDTLYGEDWLGSGYKPVMINWNTSIDCCDWNGVTCDRSTGDVIGLDLSCGMVKGTIHPNTTLFHLPHLQRLNLAYNNFTNSQLPPHISMVSNSLTHLNIAGCGFTGQVPTDISNLHKLVSLDLSENEIGLEPYVFINLLQNSTVMEELNLNYLNISSVLPNNLNISSSLKLLNLDQTGLHGNLPHSICNLQFLEQLDLSYNDFTGHIPSEITLLPKLVSLDLSWNGIDNLLMQPHIFSILLKNSTCLKNLYLDTVNIGFILPTYLNISSSLRSLSLHSTNLQGKLPGNILSLEYLEILDLSWNSNLSGPFPEVNTSTDNPLTMLFLRDTSLSGEIPTSIGHLTSLTDLFLSDTSLSGEIPTSIGHLTSLTDLHLSYTSLSGEIPTSIGNLTSLTYLDLSYTSLSREIPTSIGNLTSLIWLDLSYCGLNGSLPKSIGNLRNLVHLDLSSNKLSGTLPSSLFTLSSLKFIQLDNNMFQGNMPLELFSLQSLEALTLANNQLTGQIDVLDNGLIQQTFQRLTNLTWIDLSHNNFSGEWELDTLLSSLTNLVQLVLSYSGISVTNNNANHYVNPDFWTLMLASCNLKVFPVSIRSITTLFYLDLSDNDIQGHIPGWVGEIGRSQLELLDLSNNSITGTIPNVYEDWVWLQGFILNGNQLEGKVPTTLNKCQSLRIIDLGNNHLNDTFPIWLGDLPNLQALVLRSNNFRGGLVTSSMVKFPFPSLRVLDLSHNGFVGQLPTKYFQKLKAIKNVAKNNTKPTYVQAGDMYYYSITITMKGVDQYFTQLLVEYTVIDLSNNKFEGEIPNVIGNLNSLKVLNLSHNNLTGRIPQALGKISEIESLDLSWNQLTGEIPQTLADLTFLEVLNLSQNHLVGHIPQGKQFNTFDMYSFGGNPKLCGLPLPKKCSERLQEPQLEGDGDDEKDSGFTWKAVIMGYGCGILLGFVLGYLMLATGRPKWFNEIADAADHMILKRQKKRR